MTQDRGLTESVVLNALDRNVALDGYAHDLATLSGYERVENLVGSADMYIHKLGDLVINES